MRTPTPRICGSLLIYRPARHCQTSRTGYAGPAVSLAIPFGSFPGFRRLPRYREATRGELVRKQPNAVALSMLSGPVNAATCLLTLHFLQCEERVQTLKDIRRLMKLGAPLVVAHSSFPQDKPARERWVSRYATYAVASGAHHSSAP